MGTVYQFTDTEMRILEKQPTPLAVYQFVDGHVYTLVLSDGFLDLFRYPDREEAYIISNQNALANTHPDDVDRIGDAVHRFAVEGDRYEVIFRAKMYREQWRDGRIIHAIGEHIYTDTGVRLAYVWFMDEGEYTQDDSVQYTMLNKVFNNVLRDESFLKADYYDKMPGMCFTKDARSGVYQTCNQAFAEYANKETPEGVIGLTDFEIFNQETAAHFVEDDKKALAMDAPYVFFEDVPDAAGIQKQFQTTKLKFIDSAGRQCLLGLCQDVTEAFQIRLERDRTKRAYEEAKNDSVVYARLHALTGNFICVYVVDPESGTYSEFSATDDYTESFAQAKKGGDFFAALRGSAQIFSHPDDRDRVLSQLTQENVMEEIRQNGSFSLVYRIMMDDRPVYVQMHAAMVEEKQGPRLIVGLNDVDAQYRQRVVDREIARQKDVFDQITASLAQQYDTLYYIDIETGTYQEISSTDEYKKLNVPSTGNDFFADSRRSIRKYVHPEDQDKVIRLHYKDVMLDNLKSSHSYSMNWRLVVDGQVRHIRHTEILSRDGKHIIVCIKNIEAEVRAENALRENQKRSVTYTQIAERLADHYDMIYYIDCENTHYAELSSKMKSGVLKIQEEGDHFFETARVNADRLIFAEDRERIKLFLDKDHLISRLENSLQLTEDYRMILDNGTIQYTRMSVTYSSDHSHFIICVENRDENVRREKEHLAALAMANEMARRDELTHTKNKTAYREMEKELQQQIDERGNPFGLLVCDINGLKAVNDTKGHRAGDEYIKASCKLLCDIFAHSPVFRIGGDEFVVALRDGDYENRHQLVAVLKNQVKENNRTGKGPVVALGLAQYQPFEDLSVEDVFNRADSQMYEDKMRLKEQKFFQESRSIKDKTNLRVITEDRRIMLDTLYNAFDLVSEGTYFFLCDMKYDFSRWSKNAVDTFGLPSEYMYGAGDIWENNIHPEDREAYHKSIDELFSGTAAGHDILYRAKRLTGEYDVCTCRGVVIRDPSGEPDYFVGNIRNHSIQDH